MTVNISSFIAGILITFSALFGAQMQQTKTANDNNSVFLKLPAIYSSFADISASRYSSIEKGLTGFFENNDLRDQLVGLAALLHPSQIPKLPDVPPIKLSLAEDIPAPDFQIKAGLSVGENGKFFFQKNPHQKLPVASIAKLLTALVVLDELNPSEIITISENAVAAYGEMGKLVKDEKLTAKDLLYIMLIDSSNDAAVALAEYAERGNKNFAQLMNQKAKNLGLFDSSFSDPSGLNPQNISTAYDLAVLMNNCLMNPLIQKILNTEEIDIFSVDQQIRHHLQNTNKLLNDKGVIAGKTGYTEEAGECLVLVTKSGTENKYFISVVLGTDIGMRFTEMDKLVKWTKKVNGWQ